MSGISDRIEQQKINESILENCEAREIDIETLKAGADGIPRIEEMPYTEKKEEED